MKEAIAGLGWVTIVSASTHTHTHTVYAHAHNAHALVCTQSNKLFHSHSNLNLLVSPPSHTLQSPKPAQFVKMSFDAAQFYTNRILKEKNE